MQRFLKQHKPGSMAQLWFYISINTLPRIGDVGTFILKKYLIKGNRAIGTACLSLEL
jgi:hypothetical protein